MIAQTQGGKVRLFKPGRLTEERAEEVLRVYWGDDSGGSIATTR
jgi:hypothetical protein